MTEWPDDLLPFYPRRAEPTVRVNFIASADGAATVEGLSAGLQGPGDKEIFDLLRMQCDALLVAAGTVRAERYDALRLTASARAWRRSAGLPEFPLMVIVSRSLDLDLDQLVFSDAPIRPIVITHAGPVADRAWAAGSPSSADGAGRLPPAVAGLGSVADVIAVGEGGEVDLRAAIGELHARGATQILCEGGPQLLGAMIAADLVDELCLTVSPLLVGGGAGRIAAGPPSPARRMRLLHAISREDMLFLRYGRASTG